MERLPMILGNSLIGFLLVFMVLVVLMVFILVMNKAFGLVEKKKSKPVPETPAQPKATEIPEVVLTNVSERDAAMIMAIVADESGIPVEELRFISIKEVQE